MPLRNVTFGVFTILYGGLAFGCGAAEPKAEVRSAPIEVPARAATPVTVNAMMVGLVDHAGHALWDVERAGKAPKADKDWTELEDHAMELATAGVLITLDGPPQADPGWARLPGWSTHARELTDAGMAALAAARSRNLESLVTANGALVDACESCHKRFKPSLPSEGINHAHH